MTVKGCAVCDHPIRSWLNTTTNQFFLPSLRDLGIDVISHVLLRAAQNKKLENLVSGHPLTRGLVSRYVAGVTCEEAILVARQLKGEGINVSLDLLGEQVDDLAESAAATDHYIDTVHAIAEQAPEATVSVKLSQLGIAVDPQVCAKNLNRLLEAAEEVGVVVEVDMEHSSVGRPTLETFREALPRYPHTRVAIQAAMRRTPEDLESFTNTKPRLRLVKGAYDEPLTRALRDRKEITAQYQHLTGWILAHCPDPAFGTHDDACIEHVKKAAVAAGLGKDDFEFQMLYGVRRDVQRQLVRDGYRVRLYVPFGTQWYPYLMRRMAERPANLLFFLRSLVGR
ncbi:proline dehydrogenase family protein [Streptomyces chartreusis]|uniref:proline dehydrogenase n=1 Tax=Streptomyces chartreusis TaxID=1969 RepID=A0A7H8T0W2_STRCX|nr:proline dehydrogenase family protein [Streptomyces chartreusis]QKZ17149.1 proline dehydrogenase family protein [Streptomyces chartreusis]